MIGLPKTSIGTLPETGQPSGTLTEELEAGQNQGFRVFSLGLPRQWMLSSVGVWILHQGDGHGHLRSVRLCGSHQWLRNGKLQVGVEGIPEPGMEHLCKHVSHFSSILDL